MYRTKRKSCKCCLGTGVQTNKDGLRIPCPFCAGTGYADEPRIKWQPRL